jgi:hypothetical protein
MRMKVQDLSSIAKVKNVHQVLTLHTNKSIALILTDVDLWRIGRTSDPHGRKARTQGMTQGEAISKTEVATQAEAEVWKSLFNACFMREIRTTGQGIVPFS